MSEETEQLNQEQINDLGQLEGMAEELEPETGESSEGVAAESDDLPTDQVLIMAITPLFGVIAPNWNVQPQEIEALAGAYAPVIDKYFGGVAMGVEMNAVIITAMILAPRIGMARVAVVEKETLENEDS